MLDIRSWLKVAVDKQASDVHLSAGLAPKMRVDGRLVPLASDILEKAALQTALDRLRSVSENTAPHDPLEHDFVFFEPELARFRVHYFHQLRGPSAVFRIIPATIPTLCALGAPVVLEQLCHVSCGLILVAGPTGCGKSTTLAAMVDYMNQALPYHIVTIESPIERVHLSQMSIIQQREVGLHTLSFQQALRATLRADPDVIVVGEMRDLDSIRLALRAAETGHLVISTLHTPTAIAAIDRIISVFPGKEQAFIRHLLSMSLQAVIGQTLLHKKNGGRVAAYEVLLANTAVRHLIRDNKLHQIASIIQVSQAEGMQTRAQAVQQLIAQGVALA